MPVSESSPAIEIILVLTFKQPTCLPPLPRQRLGNERLTTLTNLNFDSVPCPNVQWFSRVPHFTALACHHVRLFRSQDSGDELFNRNVLRCFPSSYPVLRLLLMHPILKVRCNAGLRT